MAEPVLEFGMRVTEMSRRQSAHKITPETNLHYGKLLARIKDTSAFIGIIGMGYVGLPLMLACTAKKFRILGFDIDQTKVNELNSGRSPLKHVDDAHIGAMRAAGLFEATCDLGRLSGVDVVVICVPTPIGKNCEPDLSFVVQTVRAVGLSLQPSQLVVLESTTYPGTTAEVVRPILESSGLKSGRDFFLAFSPEREDPGNPQFPTLAETKFSWREGAIERRSNVVSRSRELRAIKRLKPRAQPIVARRARPRKLERVRNVSCGSSAFCIRYKRPGDAGDVQICWSAHARVPR